MGYQISRGLTKQELSVWVRDAAKKFGTFKDGRVNYKEADIAPVIMCTVLSGAKILLVKRGYGLADANGYWSIINGFIDEDKAVAEIARKELAEELRLDVKAQTIKVAGSYTLKGPKEKRAYIVFPCLVVLESRPEIILDSEHTDFAWITRSELENYHILDDLPKAIDAALKLL